MILSHSWDYFFFFYIFRDVKAKCCIFLCSGFKMSTTFCTENMTELKCVTKSLKVQKMWKSVPLYSVFDTFQCFSHNSFCVFKAQMLDLFFMWIFFFPFQKAETLSNTHLNQHKSIRLKKAKKKLHFKIKACTLTQMKAFIHVFFS